MKIYIDSTKQYATFEGFGASGAWWAQEVGGWTHIDKDSGLPVRERISQLLYSNDKGIGLRTYRYNIGGGSKQSGNGNIDNPLRRTESFEIEAGAYDFTQDANAVYMMRQVVKDGAEEVIFFVNSPLERLTKNGKTHCDSDKPFRDNLSPKNYRAFADYCLDVTAYFVKDGIPVKYLSPINEPIWIWPGGQEGCHYHPQSAGKVLKVFAEEMSKRGVLADVRLSGLESGDVRWFNKSYTRHLLKYEAVRNRVDSIDLHSYFLNPAPIPFFSRIAYLKRYRRWLDKHYPQMNVKMSEWCHMQGGRDSSMCSALVMANIMFEDISVLNVSSWQHWIAVSEVDYCDGLLYINLADKTFEMTKRYYATGNFSKYIPFGAKRVEVYAEDEDLKLLAFVKEGKTVLIVINDKNQPKTVTLPAMQGAEARLIVTNEKYNLKEFVIKNNADIEISARSVNTVIF